MGLCDKCKKNEATLVFEQIINGTKTTYHLCQYCAQSFDNSMSFDHFLKNFLGAMFSGLAESMPATAPSESKAGPGRCPTCGQSYEDFRETSRLGCADCYQAFRPQLQAALKNIQGSHSHEGKIPHRAGSELIYRRHMENLKAELAKAIQNEEFEEAARLRDLIREKQSESVIE